MKMYFGPRTLIINSKPLNKRKEPIAKLKPRHQLSLGLREFLFEKQSEQTNKGEAKDP